MDGTGRTLEEAFDDYAQKKAQELRERLEKQEVSFAKGLEEFDDAWFTVDIAIRTRPNNQWVKGFRVSDPGM